MTTTQLNVRVPVELAEQLRQAAQQQGRGVGTIVAQALTAHLAGASNQAPGALAANSPELAKQLATIERRLQALEQARPSSPKQVIAASPIEPLPDGAISTAALADLHNIRRGTLNARIARAGGAVVGLEMQGWRCVAIEVPARGGPAQALWELA